MGPPETGIPPGKATALVVLDPAALKIGCEVAGAVATMATEPGEMQVATPLASTLATLAFDEIHTMPSPKPSARVVLLLNVPWAVNWTG